MAYNSCFGVPAIFFQILLSSTSAGLLLSHQIQQLWISCFSLVLSSGDSQIPFLLFLNVFQFLSFVTARKDFYLVSFTFRIVLSWALTSQSCLSSLLFLVVDQLFFDFKNIWDTTIKGREVS